MQPLEVAVVGLLVIAFAAVSMRIEHWPLTMPMVFVTAGVVMERTGMVDLTPDTAAITLIAEVTLSVILFSDAVRIDMKRLRRQLAIPLRLLAIGMPLTILLGTFVNWLLFPERRVGGRGTAGRDPGTDRCGARFGGRRGQERPGPGAPRAERRVGGERWTRGPRGLDPDRRC